jgi:hypothetical protein
MPPKKAASSAAPIAAGTVGKAAAGRPRAADAADDPASANILARIVDHLLTPGSAISGAMQLAFNAIMAVLFVLWGGAAALAPESVHVWVFGALVLGLFLSTNWFLSELLALKSEEEAAKVAAASATAEPREVTDAAPAAVSAPEAAESKPAAQQQPQPQQQQQPRQRKVSAKASQRPSKQ